MKGHLACLVFGVADFSACFNESFYQNANNVNLLYSDFTGLFV